MSRKMNRALYTSTPDQVIKISAEKRTLSLLQLSSRLFAASPDLSGETIPSNQSFVFSHKHSFLLSRSAFFF